jgi:hypothetical protein
MLRHGDSASVKEEGGRALRVVWGGAFPRWMGSRVRGHVRRRARREGRSEGVGKRVLGKMAAGGIWQSKLPVVAR